MNKSKLNLFIVFIVFAISLSVVNIVIDKLIFGKTTLEIAINNGIEKAKEREEFVNKFLFQSEQTLQSISKLESFNRYISNASEQKSLENIFLSYAMSQTSFMQLRYIDKEGFEKIRIDRDEEKLQPYIVSINKLQNKSNRYYFFDSKTKPLGKVWFSALDLNIERGKVEVPHRPTLRAMLPISKNGKFEGILIINYLMEGFLKDLVNTPLYDVILCDDKGFPLYHYDESKKWGYYLTPKYTIESDFPNDYKQILQKDLLKTDQYISKKLDVPIYGGLHLILQLKKSYIEHQNEEANNKNIIITLFTFLISFILTLVIIKIFSEKLLNISKLKKLNEKLKTSEDKLHKDSIELEVSYNKILEQKREFETIFNTSKDGIAILDEKANFINFNQAYLEMTGFTRKELLTKNCIELTSPEDRQRSIEVLSLIYDIGHIENYQKTCIVKNGKKVVTNMSVALLPDEKRILISTKDITALKLMEEQAKLASMGEMIGNIAHQWRQPLSVISTGVTGMKIQKEYGILKDEEFIKTCDSINENAQYLSKTIDEFRNFIKGDVNIREVKISEILKGTLSLLDASLSNNYVKLKLFIEDDLEIYANKNELQQALINIINNAKDALVEKVKEDERIIFITTKSIDKETLELLIYDNAGGISADIIERIFEPYFTTKHQSKGTGLGLSMVHKIIIERYKQNISVSNKEFEYEGKQYIGACFKIVFNN